MARYIDAEYKEPTTKNDLGVDCISRADAIRVASGYCHPSNVAKELAKLPSVTPQLSVPEVTALAEWTAKLTKASEDAYNKGYEDGMKDQEPILDKLRAEIERQREKVSEKHSDNEELQAYYNGLNDGLKDARDICDKYKAEQEE